ncbi:MULTISPECIES: DUF3102 domain-containing protein [unclassified Bradyrhizobium]|uniref:DUF3102 domain-containing protein n=1 Tax=unclassified Bradyrhizobium TaxID=2631580 RepID=UPI0028E47721|nr:MULTISPECIES: DUF3102 domain-containing protein [unclassified Bradyrhizobium]
MPGRALTTSFEQKTEVCIESGRQAGPRFDYAQLPKSVATFLLGESDRIRRQYTSSIVQIGKALLGAKRYLSHGSFIVWVESEVGMPARTAQAYMRVAQWAADKSASVARLPPVILYLLSSSSTPLEITRAAIERAEAGETLSVSKLRSELKRYRASNDARSNGTAELPMSEVSTPGTDETLRPGHDVLMASIEQAIGILARELSDEDFARVRRAFTDQNFIGEPNFTTKIAGVFSKVHEGWRFNEQDVPTKKRTIDRAGQACRSPICAARMA